MRLEYIKTELSTPIDCGSFRITRVSKQAWRQWLRGELKEIPFKDNRENVQQITKLIFTS